MAFLTEMKKAIHWAINCKVEVVVIIFPLGEITTNLQRAFDKAASCDIVIIYNAYTPKPDAAKTNPPTMETWDIYPTNSQTYLFQSDHSIKKILPHMGSSSRSSAAVIGTSIAAGIAAAALSKSGSLVTKYNYSDSISISMRKRQLVREWFRDMAKASECGEDSIAIEGEEMPWSLIQASSTPNDGEDERDHCLHFSLY